MKFQNECGGDLKEYRRRWPRGLTREGIMQIVNRHLYGGVAFMGFQPMSKPNLNEPVSHTDAVGEWEPKTHE